MDIENIDELELELEDESQDIDLNIIPTGTEGLSAYEVAVKNGYEGTEEEWLESLKGADGIDGNDGSDGITPTIGNNGNWYLGETDTGKPSRGEKGETGATGQDGSDGADGFSPVASVSKSGSTATISITDKNGTTTTTINDGINGQDGADGVGVPSGGTQGQILAKTSGTDYDTQWINSPAPDLSNYYTKSETNTQITNNKTIYDFYLPDNWYWSSTGTNQRSESYFTERDIEQLSAIFEKGLENVIIRLRFNQNYPYSLLVYLYDTRSESNTYKYFGLYTNYDNGVTYGVRFTLMVNSQNTGIVTYIFTSQEQNGYVKTSKIKNTTSTTSGDVYDVTYFNSAMASANSIIGNLSNLVTTEKSNLVGAINEVAGSSGGGGEVTGIHSEKYSTLSSSNTVKTHTYFFDEGYGTSGNFISHGTDFLEKAYNDMAQYFDTSASENILQIFGKDNDGFYVLDIRLSSLTSSGTCYGKAVVITYQQMIRQQIKFNITLTDGVYKVSSLMNNGETMLLALTTQNATSYTPTASTHPATKGYVDTEISNALGTIETTLGGI